MTLHDTLNPPLLSYTLRTFQGRLKSLPYPTEPESLYTLNLPTNLVSNLPPAAQPPRLPLIKPQALRIAPSSGSQTPNPNVVVHNTKFTYFKRIPRGAEDSIIAEVSALLRIQNLDSGNKLPIPRLLALIQDPDSYGNNHIIGILLTLINAAGDLGTLATDAPGPLKRRWYRTVVHTVKTLHSTNIIWGDVKADNVLIDHQQNAWLIDFGGGVTAGWVDPELEGTKKGDLQGLQRLREFLGLDSGSRNSSASAGAARSQSGTRRKRRTGSGSATRSTSQSSKSDSGNESSGTRGGSRARSRSVMRSRGGARMASASRAAKGT
jgi:serine/threonine protein kinase